MRSCQTVALHREAGITFDGSSAAVQKCSDKTLLHPKGKGNVRWRRRPSAEKSSNSNPLQSWNRH